MEQEIKDRIHAISTNPKYLQSKRARNVTERNTFNKFNRELAVLRNQLEKLANPPEPEPETPPPPAIPVDIGRVSWRNQPTHVAWRNQPQKSIPPERTFDSDLQRRAINQTLPSVAQHPPVPHTPPVAEPIKQKKVLQTHMRGGRRVVRVKPVVPVLPKPVLPVENLEELESLEELDDNLNSPSSSYQNDMVDDLDEVDAESISFE